MLVNTYLTLVPSQHFNNWVCISYLVTCPSFESALSCQNVASTVKHPYKGEIAYDNAIWPLYCDVSTPVPKVAITLDYVIFLR